jgi:hypothetical protein
LDPIERERDMEFFLIVLGCIILAWIVYLFFFRKTKATMSRHLCSVCGSESTYGYSEHPGKDIKAVKSMCRKCLISQLENDYIAFSGRAVVIQPAPGPPCYIFHSNEEWSKSFKESKMDDDARAYLLRMDTTCHECGQKANFLWIESSGLTAQNFGNVLKKGFSETLLPRNPKPISLCGKCCIKHIEKDLQSKDITYLEVGGPKGADDGFIVPMAY